MSALLHCLICDGPHHSQLCPCLPAEPLVVRTGERGRPTVGQLGRRANMASCNICGVERHRANMVRSYDGEYLCQECRWGL